jgi:hypothetical protein
MPKMANDPVSLVIFFDTVDELYKRFAVPDDLKTVLLTPHLTQKARSLLTRINPGNASRYESVKQFLCEHYQLTPLDNRNRFNAAVKQTGETHVLFANNLMTFLDHYIRSRKIGNYIGKLKCCLVAERIRTAITDNNCLQYISSLESASKDGWLLYDKLAEALYAYWALNLSDGRVKRKALCGNR